MPVSPAVYLISLDFLRARKEETIILLPFYISPFSCGDLLLGTRCQWLIFETLAHFFYFSRIWADAPLIHSPLLLWCSFWYEVRHYACIPCCVSRHVAFGLAEGFPACSWCLASWCWLIFLLWAIWWLRWFPQSPPVFFVLFFNPSLLLAAHLCPLFLFLHMPIIIHFFMVAPSHFLILLNFAFIFFYKSFQVVLLLLWAMFPIPLLLFVALVFFVFPVSLGNSLSDFLKSFRVLLKFFRYRLDLSLASCRFQSSSYLQFFPLDFNFQNL